MTNGILCITRKYGAAVFIILPDGRSVRVHAEKTNAPGCRIYFQCDKDILIRREELIDANLEQAAEVPE